MQTPGSQGKSRKKEDVEELRSTRQAQHQARRSLTDPDTKGGGGDEERSAQKSELKVETEVLPATEINPKNCLFVNQGFKIKDSHGTGKHRLDKAVESGKGKFMVETFSRFNHLRVDPGDTGKRQEIAAHDLLQGFRSATEKQAALKGALPVDSTCGRGGNKKTAAPVIAAAADLEHRGIGPFKPPAHRINNRLTSSDPDQINDRENPLLKEDTVLKVKDRAATATAFTAAAAGTGHLRQRKRLFLSGRRRIP